MKQKMLNFKTSQTSTFKFWVKGPGEAYITLVPNKTSLSQDGRRYYVAIGGFSNRRAWIAREGQRSNSFSPFAHGNYLNSTEYRPFWLSWANHTITLGRGQHIGKDVITSRDISSHPIDVNFLYVRSYGSVTVHFKYTYYYNGNFF